jgi:tRNA threonylcarbamoyladenosine biosynthesis protein TsaE
MEYTADICSVLAKGSHQTTLCGASLAASIPLLPITITLSGELGAGKTTFVQGFAKALGIRDTLASPTYALEQRYATPRGELLHIDLYRLPPDQAEKILHGSDDFRGIRCIEWSERVAHTDLLTTIPLIRISIAETDSRNERRIECAFCDSPALSKETVETWRQEMCLPEHVARHCDAVADMALRLGRALVERHQLVRLRALHEAGMVHDLLRFIDFRPEGHPAYTPSPAELATWERWKNTFAGLHHEAACATFLREKGFPVIADIVSAHGLRYPPTAGSTIEQKILYYADKRIRDDVPVTLAERFKDFTQRYGKGTVTPDNQRWHGEATAVEDALFPDGVPF